MPGNAVIILPLPSDITVNTLAGLPHLSKPITCLASITLCTLHELLTGAVACVPASRKYDTILATGIVNLPALG